MGEHVERTGKMKSAYSIFILRTEWKNPLG